MYTMIRRVHSPPLHKDWYLCFTGDPESLCEFEDWIRAYIDVLGPVVYDNGNQGELNIYLDWNDQKAKEIFDWPMAKYNVELLINTRRGEATCQEST